MKSKLKGDNLQTAQFLKYKTAVFMCKFPLMCNDNDSQCYSNSLTSSKLPQHSQRTHDFTKFLPNYNTNQCQQASNKQATGLPSGERPMLRGEPQAGGLLLALSRCSKPSTGLPPSEEPTKFHQCRRYESS